jgi:hypothetical protein
MQTQVFENSVQATNSAAIVNSIDASMFDDVQFTTLPSTKANVATLKPLAVFDKAKEVDAIVAAADILKNEHENYEKQFVEGGRKALYSLLAKIYALAIQINNSDYVDTILKELRTKLTLRGVRTQKNSNAVTMLVKWVVGVNRQTAHNYSNALQAAFKDNVSAQELSEYFTKRGGLQAAKTEGARKNKNEKNEMSKELERYISNVDKNSSLYENTSIKWTEKIVGDSGSLMMMILGHSSGGGQMQGLRAFYLSDSAYAKIRKILVDEYFQGKTVEDVARIVDKEQQYQEQIVRAKEGIAQ